MQLYAPHGFVSQVSVVFPLKGRSCVTHQFIMA
jgi:hypothetical protein